MGARNQPNVEHSARRFDALVGDAERAGVAHGGFACLACDSTDWSPWYESCRDYYRGLGQVVNYVRCGTCSLVQQCPVPENVAALYNAYPVHVRRSWLQQRARRWMQREVYHRPDASASARVLFDYGCGDGVYLREVGYRFLHAAGYEPAVEHAAAISVSSGFRVYSDMHSADQDLHGVVDIVTAHYVMEHVVDLRGTMAFLAGLLKPGGTLHIAVPNIRSWEARLFGRLWHGLDAPRHISFPDADTFRRLAATHGMRLASARHATFPNTLAGSISNVVAGRHHAAVFMAMILPSWMITAVFPSGTDVFVLQKPRTPGP